MLGHMQRRHPRPVLRGLEMKKAFLVLYDYGQGGVWAYLLADSIDEIRRKFPQLRVYERPPDWMDHAEAESLRVSMTIDNDSREHPFLVALLKGGTTQ